MKKRSLIFIIPAVILVGLLCYAVINALCIYIPQEKAQKSYRDLKESVRIVEDDAKRQDPSSSGGADTSGAGSSGMISISSSAFSSSGTSVFTSDSVGAEAASSVCG